MPPIKFLTLAISSLLLLAGSLGPSSANALSIDSRHDFAHQYSRSHHALLQKKRAAAKRCKVRPTSSAKPAAASTTSSAQEAAKTTQAAAPQNNNNGAHKVGLAWPNGDDASLANFKSDKTGPIYTWSPWLPTNAKKLGFNPIPMFWGESQRSDFKRLVVKGYANTVMGFNEPDLGAQSNMSPQRGAQLWQQDIQPLANEGYSLITPACTNGPSGKIWQKAFFAACQGCTFDGMAVHYYGTNPQDMINYITDMHNTFGLDIWVTEFACQNFSGGAQASQDQIFQFMKTVTAWMDQTPWVNSYFAFGVMHDMGNVNPANQLMAGNGQPTALGKEYLN